MGQPGQRQATAPKRRFMLALAVFAVAAAALLGNGTALATTYNPATDGHSMFNTARFTGAEPWWNAGYTGAGIDVAVIDTGVSPVEGLAAPGKVIYGPDLSLESQAPNLRNLDTNGHGTFMAGLIAGKDATLTAPYANAPATAYRGIAPDARIVSIKVGVADGGVDVSQVIAAIYWAIEHKNDNGLNIRVISLAYATNSTQKYVDDPLAFAVEQAWKRGIVVVAAAGNSGYQKGGGAPGLATPANDPFIIGVAGLDQMGTALRSDDRIGAYSTSGCGATCKKPDIVAPGSHLQGLRVPNSYIDANYPGGRLGDRYFRGSGTSQATAITAGAVALVLQKYPTLSPDSVKKFFQDNATKVSGADGAAQGPGQMRLEQMAIKAPGTTTQKFTASTGRGSLDASRGTDRLTRDGVVLSGEQDIFGRTFDSAQIATMAASGSTWSGGVWNGSTWSGSTWSGSTWSGSTWSGSTWSGSTWSGSTWSGSSWSGSSWSGNSWATGSWD